MGYNRHPVHADRPMKSDWGMLFRYFRETGESRRLIPLQTLLLTVDAVMQASIPLLSGIVIDQLTHDPQGFKAKVAGYLTVTILGTLAFYLISFTQHCWANVIGQRAGVRFQVELFNHLQKLSADFYQRTQVGEITTRLTNDINQGINPLYGMFLTVYWALAMLVISFISMSFINLHLLMVFIGVVIIIGYLTRLVSQCVRIMNREVRDEAGRITARITESIYANSLIRAFAQEAVVSAEVQERSASYLEKAIRVGRFTLLFSDILNTFLGIFAPMAVLLISALFVGGKVTVGAIVSMVLYCRMAAMPINNFLNGIPQFYASFASMDRIFEFFRETPLVEDDPNAHPLQVTLGEIEIRDVSFRYPVNDGGEVLHQVSFTAEANKSLALVGESGAGKTTLIQLLLRFYDPSSGQVLVDGQDLRTVTQTSLRQQVGLVMQETILLSGSIRENMQFAKADATDEEIIAALQHAEAWNFVREMPDGLDTVLGERGARLSGGQKQRISIARVFLKNPPIVIFDEATSSLDTITEQQIQETMNRLYEQRTAIIIAHRLSTIVNCDRILVLEKGAVIASGSHQELLSTCLRYREMCSRQSMGQVVMS